MVIFLGNGIFCCKPEILMGVQCIIKACFGKAFDGSADVVLPLNNARSIKLVNQFTCLFTGFIGINKFRLACCRNLHLCCLINITICMSGNSNWFLPCSDCWFNTFHNDWRTENSTIKNGTDRTIRALPHFFQIVFFHTSSVRCDCCTFDSNTVFLCCHGRINGYLIVGLISVLQPQIIIFCLQINKWKKQFVFDHLPENSCHLIAVHLNQRCCHFNLVHRHVLP